MFFSNKLNISNSTLLFFPKQKYQNYTISLTHQSINHKHVITMFCGCGYHKPHFTCTNFSLLRKILFVHIGCYSYALFQTLKCLTLNVVKALRVTALQQCSCNSLGMTVTMTKWVKYVPNPRFLDLWTLCNVLKGTF